LAERARANLVDAGEAATRPAPAREPEQTLPPPRPSTKPEHTHSAAVKATHRRPSNWRRAILVVALAAGLGGAGAIWVHYDDNASSSGGLAQPATHAQLEQLLMPARSERSETTRSRAPKQALRPPRTAAFHVPGAPEEPLDEITLPARARRLDAWLTPARGPTAANQRHWLYQHAWIVAGAKFGWWHGAEALRVLIHVDRRVASQWGIGYRSEAAARRTLAAVKAK